MKSKYRGTMAALGAMSALAVLVACVGGNQPALTRGSFQKVSPSDRNLAFEDFQAIGYRKSKEYNVDGLPQATGAWFGFWRPQGQDPVEYELRFYPSHQAAVEHGTPLAEEVTGKDAVLKSDDVTWKEGTRDRRAQGGSTGNRGFSGTVWPRYGDFAIFGNVVMLCEGRDAVQSLGRCEAIVNALRTHGTE